MSTKGIVYEHENLTIRFGPLTEPLHRQLDVAPSRMALFQKIADALTILSLDAYLTDGETHRARKRLIRKIEQEYSKWKPTKKC